MPTISPVPRLLEQLNPYLRVTRVSSAFAAVANVWFVVLWTRAVAQEPGTPVVVDEPVWIPLLCSAIAAIGLYTLSACMNDLIDARRDRAYGKDQPIASGKLSTDAGAHVAVLSLIAAAAGATPLGPVPLLLTLALAAAILLYHIIGRFVPALGLAMVGVIVAGQMLVPNAGLRFLWPVWLVLTHTLATFGLAHVLGRKVPPLSTRALIAAIFGWVLWSAALLVLGWDRSADDAVVRTIVGPLQSEPFSRAIWPEWVKPSAAIPPAISIALFIAVLARKMASSAGSGPRVGDKIIRYGTAWLPFHGVAWMIGIGAWTQAAILGVLGAAGLFGMATLREAYSLSSQPVTYRL